MNKDLYNSAFYFTHAMMEVIYDDLSQCVNNQSPHIVIKKFKSLFFHGKSENPQVSIALEKIIFDSLGQQKFEEFLSHCCYLILDKWSSNPQSLSYSRELLESFDHLNQTQSYDRRRKHLIRLVALFRETIAYYQLTAIVTIINPTVTTRHCSPEIIVTEEINNNGEEINNKILNNYLARYTYLYSYFLPLDLQFIQLRRLIENQQKQRQQAFELQLSKHIIYRFRIKQVAQMKLLSKGAGKIITKVNNPTLLSERAFKIAMQQYIGKINQHHTLIQQCKRFVADNNLRDSYGIFKQDLQHLLTSNIQPRYHNYDFSNQLEQKLAQILPQSNNLPLNKNLILQTCRQLLRFLIGEPTACIDNQKLKELTTNLGTDQTMLILVKITLICPESRVYLYQKLTPLVTNYQFYRLENIQWLVKSLEHLLIAFSICFGKVDVWVTTSEGISKNY